MSAHDTLTDNEGQTTPEEQSAALASLMAKAADDPQPGAAGTVAETEPEPGPELAKEIMGLLLMGSALFRPVFPSLERIYTPEACEQAGAAIAAVCSKHGWLQGGMMGDYAVEFAAFAVLAPLGIATYAGVQEDLRVRKAKSIPAEEAGPIVGQQKPVTETEAETVKPNPGVTFGDPDA